MQLLGVFLLEELVLSRLFSLPLGPACSSCHSLVVRDIFCVSSYVVSVSRNAGVRIGKYLNEIVPLLVKFCSEESADRSQEQTIQLRENCLEVCSQWFKEKIRGVNLCVFSAIVYFHVMFLVLRSCLTPRAHTFNSLFGLV